MPPSFRTPVLRRPHLLIGWALLAAIPVAYVAAQAIAASRNIVFWDEFDTALDLLLRINAGANWTELFQRFFAVNNEHRMATSRLLFATSYWLTGTINFHVIGAIGNLFLVGACAALVLAGTGGERRIRMTVVLAFLMFQLEHFESFIWSGSSIDHFQVVMLAMLAVAALARRTTAGSVAGAGFGLLATFTLAQGNVVWPVGALLLAHQRRWKELAAWLALGAAAVAAFLTGFKVNPSHGFTDLLSPSRIAGVARHWLNLLGAPLTLGETALAPLPGAALLGALGFLGARGMAARQPVAFFGALFGIGALALVALGRAELAGTAVNSRYLVLGALAWALVIFLVIELGVETNPARPFRLLACTVPALATFTLAANTKFAPMIETFTVARDRAATSFQQFGVDGHGIARLHPKDRHADILLKMAENRGVYRLPEFSFPAAFPTATPSTRIVSHVDELYAGDRAVTVGGWAMLPGREAVRGQVHVVLKSEKSQLFFSSMTLPRPDVATALKEPKWRLGGFRAVIARARLPAEDFAIGLLVTDGKLTEFVMTQHQLLLAPGRAATAVRSPAPGATP